MMMHFVLLLIYAALQAADYFTTTKALERGAYEFNPVMAALIRKLGRRTALITAKVAVTVPFAFIAPSGASVTVLALLCGFYIATLVNNVRVLGGLR